MNVNYLIYDCEKMWNIFSSISMFFLQTITIFNTNKHIKKKIIIKRARRKSFKELKRQNKKDDYRLYLICILKKEQFMLFRKGLNIVFNSKIKKIIISILEKKNLCLCVLKQ